jgi:hypothetical protein
MYILNGEEVFFGFYPVLEHKVMVEEEPIAIFDPMGKDAVLFYFSSTGDPASTGSKYVAEAQKWFDSVWNSVTRPVFK